MKFFCFFDPRIQQKPHSCVHTIPEGVQEVPLEKVLKH